MLLDMAVVAERDALRDQALEQVGRLDSSDDVIRLRRLNVAVDRHHTAEERIAAYEKILAEKNRDRLGPAVASRLALDLAFLNRRVGNTEAFADWLAQIGQHGSVEPGRGGLGCGLLQLQC